MIEQLAILTLGVLTITIMCLPPAMRRYADIVGLLSLPLWIHSAYTHDQWGIITMCALFGLLFLKSIGRGFHIHWYNDVFRKHNDQHFRLRRCRCGKTQILTWGKSGDKKWHDLDKAPWRNAWEKDYFQKSIQVPNPLK